MDIVVVGGSAGLGFAIATRMVGTGRSVVITSRSRERAEAAARALGPHARGIAVDLAATETIETALASVEAVDGLVITAIEQGVSRLVDFDLVAATRAVTIKLVGYPEVVRVLHDRFTANASIVLFGGLAKDRPYPGSTIVTAFNQGITGLVKTLAVELAPTRVNAVHPGVVGDTPRWVGVDHPHRARTPLGRLVTTDEVVEATEFLLTNTGINAQDLSVDGGLLAT